MKLFFILDLDCIIYYVLNISKLIYYFFPTIQLTCNYSHCCHLCDECGI